MEEEKINEVIKTYKNIRRIQAFREIGRSLRNPCTDEIFFAAANSGTLSEFSRIELEVIFGENVENIVKRRVWIYNQLKERNPDAAKYIILGGKENEKSFREVLRNDKNAGYYLQILKYECEQLEQRLGANPWLAEFFNSKEKAKSFNDALRQSKYEFRVPKESEIVKWFEGIYEKLKSPEDEFLFDREDYIYGLIVWLNSDKEMNNPYEYEERRIAEILNKDVNRWHEYPFEVGQTNVKPEYPYLKIYGTMERSKGSELAKKVAILTPCTKLEGNSII